MAIQAARKENMPKDNIERAIKKADPSSGEANFEEIRYEGYGPGNVAVIVEALTDNKNRTAPEVRSIFSKNGGNLGETGSVSFLFNRVGLITYPLSIASEEEMLEAAIEAGAENVTTTKSGHEITCAPEDLHKVVLSLEEKFKEPETAKLDWQPLNFISLDQEKAEIFIKFLDALEDNDDVQSVSTNADIPDEILEKLSA